MLSYVQRIFSKYIGGRIDRDKMYGYQCVDLVKQFADESGFPITTYGNAIDLWKTWLWPNYIKIANAGWNFPKEGDVVIFSWPTKYGHICIADAGCTKTKLNVIEQNAATWNGDGKGGNAIRKHTYDYINPKCVGWFTPKR